MFSIPSDSLRSSESPVYSGYIHTEVCRVSFWLFPSTKSVCVITGLDPFPLRSVGAALFGNCERNSEILALGFSISSVVPKEFFT